MDTLKHHEIQDSNGCIRRYVEENRIVISESNVKMVPPDGDFKKHLNNIKQLVTRDDDIYVATCLKSGTHWIWEIIKMLLKGKAMYEEDIKETSMLEFIPVDELDAIPSPRVLNTHYPLHILPEGVFKQRCKIVHVMRNIKDVIVSFLHHFNAFAQKNGETMMELEDILALFIGDHGFYFYYPWHEYILEWQKMEKERPDQVLNMSYEDMHKDIVKEIKKVAHFLELQCDDDLVSQIAENCSFKKLKKANEELKNDRHKMNTGTNHIMFRKGEVGGWKNWFTVAQNERIDRWLEEHLRDTDIEVRFTL